MDGINRVGGINGMDNMDKVIYLTGTARRRACHGWILYASGDKSLDSHYVGLYQKACGKRGMSIELGICSMEDIWGKEGMRQVRELVRKEEPTFAINRTRDWSLAKMLEQMGIRVYNDSCLAKLGNDKAEAYRYMEQRGIPSMPVVYGADVPPPWYPAVAKACRGHGGTEVYLIKDEGMWQDWKENVCQPGKEYVIQQAASDLGRDVRVYVVGDQAVAAVQRTSETDFRSNFCLGGSVGLYRLTEEERFLVEQAVSGLSVGMAGIDFIFHNGKMVFNEIEDVAGARGLYSLADYDIVDEYVGFIQSEL